MKSATWTVTFENAQGKRTTQRVVSDNIAAVYAAAVKIADDERHEIAGIMREHEVTVLGSAA